MEQQGVARIHLQVYALGSGLVFDAEESRVDVFPVRVRMREQLPLVASGHRGEASGIPGRRGKRGPCAHDAVRRPYPEVAQILMQRVAAVHAGGLVEDVRRYAVNVGPDQIAHRTHQPGLEGVTVEDGIVLEVDHLVHRVESRFGQRRSADEHDVAHDLHRRRRRDRADGQRFETRVVSVQRSRCQELGHHHVAVFPIVLDLIAGEYHCLFRTASPAPGLLRPLEPQALQLKTTVRLPFRRTRCSAWYRTAFASTTRSISRPTAASWSADMR